MKKILVAVVLLAFIGINANTPDQAEAKTDTLQAPKIFVLKYDADW